MTSTSDDPDLASAVTLRELTAETFWPVLKLEVAPEQEQFVAPNVTSVAEAYFSERAWFRGIYAGDTPVGFLMVELPDPAAGEAERSVCFLWRLMIAAEHQGRGYGRQALRALIDHLRTERGATRLLTSYVPGEGGPRDFYRKLGFVETGEVDGGELVTALDLTDAAAPPPG
jgi:diamine N-acetyltransferase